MARRTLPARFHLPALLIAATSVAAACSSATPSTGSTAVPAALPSVAATVASPVPTGVLVTTQSSLTKLTSPTAAPPATPVPTLPPATATAPPPTATSTPAPTPTAVVTPTSPNAQGGAPASAGLPAGAAGPATPPPLNSAVSASSRPRLPDVAAPRRARTTAAPVVGAITAVVIDGDSGAVLYDKDAHVPRPPASTTKILTALLAIERLPLDQVIDVQLDPTRAYWGSAMGLVSGDRFTVRDLLYGLMLPSGNDAAYVLATAISGSEREFATLMTAKMRELGLTENSWMNASGLGRAETSNYVSAYDLAQLSRVAMQEPFFRELAAARYYTARGSRTIGMTNLNQMVHFYPGADGVKIGWGGAFAGHTIVASATRNGHRVFVTLLNTPDRAGESAALLNWAFSTFEWGN